MTSGMGDDVVTVERIIRAPAEEIFELIGDPSRHHLFDGSGTVRVPTNAPPQLFLGAKFNMRMKMGFPYTMTNEVIEFDEGRRIAWQPRPAFPLARRLGGRIWRYELEPVAGGTRVRETWDITQERWIFRWARGFAVGAPGFRFMATPTRARDSMTATLQRIDDLVGDQ
jgi:uncharacterized protein YndB with AHSA1/START domain